MTKNLGEKIFCALLLASAALQGCAGARPATPAPLPAGTPTWGGLGGWAQRGAGAPSLTLGIHPGPHVVLGPFAWGAVGLPEAQLCLSQSSL